MPRNRRRGGGARGGGGAGGGGAMGADVKAVVEGLERSPFGMRFSILSFRSDGGAPPPPPPPIPCVSRVPPVPDLLRGPLFLGLTS